MKRSSSSELQELAADAGDLEALNESFAYCVNNRGQNVFRRMKRNYDTRLCLRPGKTEDFRKWARDRNGEIFPWPGASDIDVPLADKYIKEDLAFLMVLWGRMRTQVRGVESNDSKWGSQMTSFLRWMKYTQMEESRRETELTISYMLEGGCAVKGTFWEKKKQLGYSEIRMQDLQGAAQEALQRIQRGQGGPQLEVIAELPLLIQDPTMDETTVKLAAQFLPNVQTSRLPQIIRDLRNTGYAKFPEAYVVQDRPVERAYRPNEDIIIEPEAESVRTAGEIHCLELLSETTLRARAGWDKKWLAEMLRTQKGRFSQMGLLQRQNTLRTSAQLLIPTSRLFEVIHTYRLRGDDEGVPGYYYTCWSPGVKERVAYNDLLNYDHGQTPFTQYSTETRSRNIDDARGYGEQTMAFQAQIKREWDSRVDRASITTLPPSYYPKGQAPDAWGPGVQVPVDRKEDYGFYEGPQPDNGSREIEESVRRFSDEYRGRPVDEQNAPQAQAMQQYLADNFMASEQQADTQKLQLCQQFMPEEFYYRVIGSGQGKSIRASRQDIQGKFDLLVSFNTENFDREKVDTTWKLIRESIQIDRNGIIDHNEALASVYEMIDPNLGERILKPAESAALQEAEDEDNIWAQIAAGLAPDVKPGQAYELRLQRLMTNMRQSPDSQQRYMQDPNYKARIDKRVKQLTFQIQQQQENPEIGRVGPDAGKMPVAKRSDGGQQGLGSGV